MLTSTVNHVSMVSYVLFLLATPICAASNHFLGQVTDTECLAKHDMRFTYFLVYVISFFVWEQALQLFVTKDWDWLMLFHHIYSIFLTFMNIGMRHGFPVIGSITSLCELSSVFLNFNELWDLKDRMESELARFWFKMFFYVFIFVRIIWFLAILVFELLLVSFLWADSGYMVRALFIFKLALDLALFAL